MVLFWILISVFAVSLISLAGIVSFGMKSAKFDTVLIVFVGLAAGVLIGSAFLHLLPQALKESPAQTVFLYALTGFTGFFILERYLYWRHCHDGVCPVHMFTYLNLIGDGIHNFIDGLVIAASFISSMQLGFVTTFAVILHEIPQELGDFGILVYGGFSKRKALVFNFICAMAAVGGAVLGYAVSHLTTRLTAICVPLAAGGFIYIAAADLLPELHRHKDTRRANLALVMFIAGIIIMTAIR